MRPQAVGLGSRTGRAGAPCRIFRLFGYAERQNDGSRAPRANIDGEVKFAAFTGKPRSSCGQGLYAPPHPQPDLSGARSGRTPTFELWDDAPASKRS